MEADSGQRPDSAAPLMRRKVQRSVGPSALSWNQIRPGRIRSGRAFRSSAISSAGVMRSKPAARWASSAWWPPSRPLTPMMRGNVPVTAQWDTLPRQTVLSADTQSRNGASPPLRGNLCVQTFSKSSGFSTASASCLMVLRRRTPERGMGRPASIARVAIVNAMSESPPRSKKSASISVTGSPRASSQRCESVRTILSFNKSILSNPPPGQECAQVDGIRAFGLDCRRDLNTWAAQSAAQSLIRLPLDIPRGPLRPAVH